MFLTLDDLVRTLLVRSPSLALIVWEERSALVSFLERLKPTIQAHNQDTIVSEIIGTSLNSQSFLETFLAALEKTDAHKTCLVLYEMEPLLSAAGRILNGYREKLASFRAVIIANRQNRQRDLLIECPDLMDWIGLTISHAEDLSPPFTLLEVNEAIKNLEKHYQMKSAKFVEKYLSGDKVKDAWLWMELIYIRLELERSLRL